MGLLVNDILGRAFVHVGMRFELEEQVQHVDQEEHDTGTTADGQDSIVGLCRTVLIEGSMEGSLRRCQRAVRRSGCRGYSREEADSSRSD